MEPISSEIVERTWRKMSTMPLKEFLKLVSLMQKQQPFVLVYLSAVGHKIFNQDEQEQMLYLGAVIWRIMLQGNKPLIKVTGDILDEAEKENIKMLEYLADGSETDFIDTTKKIINNYPQSEVLKYVVEALMEEPEEEYPIRDESKGYMLIYLKTIIDCFNR